MKYIATILLSAFITTSTCGQGITYDDFRALIPYMQKEDFAAVFEKSGKLLDGTQDDSSDVRAIVRYMNIYSAAAMVSLGKMSHDDLAKHVKKYVGQYLVMSGHPCIDSGTVAFNSLSFGLYEGKLQGNTTTANKTQTSIYSFERFTYAEEIDPKEFIGKNVRCGGKLNAFEVNPNKSTIWIIRLFITDAFARALN